MSHTVTLRNWQHASEVLRKSADWIKVRVMTGRAVTLTLAEQKRSNAQNALLHALLTDISKTREWAGSRHDIETWKRLLTASWCRARGEQVKVLPALDGHGVDLVFRRTSTLTKAELSELVDFVQAWVAQEER